MLLANRLVAETLTKKCPEFAILRSHLPPDRNILEIREFLIKFELLLDFQFSNKEELMTFYS